MTERYSHFDPDYLHSKLDELMRFQPAKAKPDPEPVAAAAVAAPAPEPRPAAFSTRFLPDAPDGGSGGLDGTGGDSGTCVGAGYRGRTGDIQLGKLTLYQLS
jgi:hypothetical protein